MAGHVRIQRGIGGPDPPPPGKSQVTWVSLDSPWEKMDPRGDVGVQGGGTPLHPWKMSPPPPPSKLRIPLKNIPGSTHAGMRFCCSQFSFVAAHYSLNWQISNISNVKHAGSKNGGSKGVNVMEVGNTRTIIYLYVNFGQIWLCIMFGTWWE